MSGDIQTIRVQDGVLPDDGTTKVNYRRRDGAWYVEDPDTGEWEKFADADAGRRTVQQLLRKEYDARY